jgi:hypothetical protein
MEGPPAGHKTSVDRDPINPSSTYFSNPPEQRGAVLQALLSTLYRRDVARRAARGNQTLVIEDLPTIVQNRLLLVSMKFDHLVYGIGKGE